jgi:Tol biopolymer transport system component/DNA-binding winged helix-turn-helix (wHTH) protein
LWLPFALSSQKEVKPPVDKPNPNGQAVRFGVFELDLKAGELRRSGSKVKLQDQPFQILKLLLEHPGGVVTQSEIVAALWPDGTVVEYEHSIKTALMKLRQVLGDDAGTPRYVETLPRRGYRFIYPVDGVVSRLTQEGQPHAGLRTESTVPAPQIAAVLRERWPLWLAGSLAVVVAVLAIARYVGHGPGTLPKPAEREITANPLQDGVTGAAISPDGKNVAYYDKTGLYLRSIHSGETHAVSLPAALEDALVDLEWFPDGGKLLADARSSEGSDLWVINIFGQAEPRLLYRHGMEPAISPDGQSVAFEGYTLGKRRFEGIWTVGINGEALRKLVGTKEDQSVFSPAWSPDGHWIAYVRTWKTAQGSDTSAIEVRPASGGPARTVVPDSTLPKSSSLDFTSCDDWPCLCWSPDWHLVFAVSETAGLTTSQAKYGLWEIPVEPHTGEAAAKPERLAQWNGSFVTALTMAADGKRLAFLKMRIWYDVYVARLRAGAATIQAPRRLTLDNRGSLLNDWTRDSQAVLFTSDRDGNDEVFRQGVDEGVAEPVVQGPLDDYAGKSSPDGSWLLYIESPVDRPGAPPSPSWLKRRPAAGGPPVTLLEEPADLYWDFSCPRQSGSPCVLLQKEGKHVVFYTLDPVRGKGHRLGALEVVTPDWDNFGVSPDGSRLALVDDNRGRIKVLTFRDSAWHEVPVEPAWGLLQSIAWAADGKGFFVTSWLPDSWNLLHVTLNGRVQPLLRNRNRQWMYKPVPSPDGKWLAFRAQTWDSNVWMLEKF